MEIITKKIEDVTPADYNPRQITKEALQGLMELSPEYCDMAIFRWEKNTSKKAKKER